ARSRGSSRSAARTPTAAPTGSAAGAAAAVARTGTDAPRPRRVALVGACDRGWVDESGQAISPPGGAHGLRSRHAPIPPATPGLPAGRVLRARRRAGAQSAGRVGAL